MDWLQMKSMHSSGDHPRLMKACRFVFARPEECVLGQCSLASPMEYTFYGTSAVIWNMNCVLLFTAGRAGVQQRTIVAQSMGFPSRFICSIRAFIRSFFLSVTLSIGVKELWAGG